MEECSRLREKHVQKKKARARREHGSLEEQPQTEASVAEGEAWGSRKRGRRGGGQFVRGVKPRRAFWPSKGCRGWGV